MSQFIIMIESSHPDAQAIARKAAEKVACEVGWGDDQTAEIWFLGVPDGATDYLDTRQLDALAEWFMEPGDQDAALALDQVAAKAYEELSETTGLVIVQQQMEV